MNKDITADEAYQLVQAQRGTESERAALLAPVLQTLGVDIRFAAQNGLTGLEFDARALSYDLLTDLRQLLIHRNFSVEVDIPRRVLLIGWQQTIVGVGSDGPTYLLRETPAD